jgi:hypothetical protein
VEHIVFERLRCSVADQFQGLKYARARGFGPDGMADGKTCAEREQEYERARL